MHKSKISPGNQELICIQTDKVYDWIVNESNFDLNLAGLDLPINPATGVPLECTDISPESVTCVIEPDEVLPAEVANRQDQVFQADGEDITLQLVTIRKNFSITLFVDLIPTLGGATVEVGTVPFTRCEQVLLCAPEGTDISVRYTDLNCFVCNVTCDSGTTTEADELSAMVSVRLCQSIQSTYEVIIEILADFCQPRDAEIALPTCPKPVMPAQCPVIFPASCEIRNDKTSDSIEKEKSGYQTENHTMVDKTVNNDFMEGSAFPFDFNLGEE
ncbi:BMQ_0737 family morphogenetic spore coat protein [Gracilibacillus oryzae]|uniref:hypothetical protein n=1 Tax=Gracilibacillus oryzae TaxID=1672701 RepID=UPI001D1899BF|nr:hypothetical protein [Gracilibacillus oryzae]